MTLSTTNAVNVPKLKASVGDVEDVRHDRKVQPSSYRVVSVTITLPATIAHRQSISAAYYKSVWVSDIKLEFVDRFLLTSVAATTATATSSTVATTTVAAATATTSVPSHLGQTRINLLFSLLEHIHEFTSLLGVWRKELAKRHLDEGKTRWYLLSVVKKVTAVPVWPARPVRPIRWM